MVEYNLRRNIRAYQWGVDPTMTIFKNCGKYVRNEHLRKYGDDGELKHLMAMTCRTCKGKWLALEDKDWIIVEDIGGNDTWEVTDVISDEEFRWRYKEV